MMALTVSSEKPALEVATKTLVDNRDSISGQTIGHYSITSRVGAGGMGEVYLAQDTKLDRKVAIKLLPESLLADERARKRLVREAQAAAKLDHPNICPVYEVGEEDGRSFIVMQYVEGETLDIRLKRGPFNASESIALAAEVADALAEAHAHAIIHRDIKPSNIIITQRGQAKVLDFGLAKLSEPLALATGLKVDAEASTQALLTTPGSIIGTVPYMSPEQARGLGVDARTDVWSLGVVLYEMLTGRVPFEGETNSDVIASILEREPSPLAKVASDAPSELQRIVAKALRKDRDKRYQTIKDMLLDLKSLKEQLDAARLSGKIKQHKTALALILVSLVMAAAVVVYLARLHQREANPQPPPQRSLSRLTFDAGLQSEPTWSPDGRFIAYSSDKSGNFDIWVQPIGGGDALQVTHSPAHDWQPDWSPDGSQIVFRSEREGGGLFVVPALGGREHNISSFGYHPSWSPDGTKILFSNLGLGGAFAPKVYVVSIDGNPPREVQPELLANFVSLGSVIWHPDGQRISLWGIRKDQDWGLWTVPQVDGTPVKSEISDEVDNQFIENAVAAPKLRWGPSGRAIYFEGISRGLTNLWKVTVDPKTLRWVAGPERLTTGFNDADIALSVDAKRLAFTARTENTRAWSLPFDPRAGKIKGEGQPVTATGVNPVHLNLSSNGEKLLYVATRAGTNNNELWEKSLEDGRETLVTTFNETFNFFPCWSRDGKRIAYRHDRSCCFRDDYLIQVQAAGGGDQQVIASGADDCLWDWSADGQWILVTSDRDSPRRLGVLALYPLSAAPHAERQRRVVTSHPEYNLFQARFSPDDRWVCFNAVKAGNVSTIYVVPSSGGEWTRITEDNVWSDKPHWSPDGKTIYFLSNRATGFYNVWGIRFDPQQGKPVGEPFRVTSFDSPGKVVWSNLGSAEITLSADRLVVPITEVTGNIWMLDGVDR